jgi:hypothetical protein
MRTRRDSHDVDLGHTAPAEELIGWNVSFIPVRPEDAARRDFADALEKHRKNLEELLKGLR